MKSKLVILLITCMVLLSLGTYNVTLACDVTPTPTKTPRPTHTPTNILTSIPTNTKIYTPTYTQTTIPTNTPTYIPTNTPIPTNTLVNTSTDIPTNTPTNIPTSTPTITNSPTIVPTIPTSVPACIPYETNRVVNVLYMYNSSPLHYGYFDINGNYIGICRIETAAGQVPNAEFVQQFCTCEISDFTWTTSRMDVWSIIENCDGTTALHTDDSHQSSFMVNWKFGNYCPVTKCVFPK